MITDISRRNYDFSGESSNYVNDQMQLGIEPSPRHSNPLIFSTSRAVGVLMNFVMGAVVEHRFGIMATEHPLFNELGKSRK